MARRAGFTLIEMLVVMLVIITVLAMGVPAMFSADRKAWVSAAMNQLVDLHLRAQRLQRRAAAEGLADVYSIQVTNPAGGTQPRAELRKNGASLTSADLAALSLDPMQVTVSISGDDLVESVKQWNGSAFTNLSFGWSYEPQTGCIVGPRQDMQFAALNGRYTRTLKIFPLGFTEGN